MELYNPAVIRAIRNKYGFRFSKSLGQNFLTSKEVIDGIVEGAGIGPKDLIIEIGPGIGVLTQAAAEAGDKVIAIELDSNLITILADTLSGYENVEVLNQDVLKTDLTGLIETEKQGREHVRIIGNLPYYITTAIIMKLLEERVPCDSITIMMQKEVAQRIVSPPGSRVYGALSVAVQYYCEVEIVEEVPKESFMPMPKVDSTVITLYPRKEPRVELIDENLFFRLVKAGFGQRRKTLTNSLRQAGFTREEIEQALSACGIEQKRRAETLSVEDFGAIANFFSGNRVVQGE